MENPKELKKLNDALRELGAKTQAPVTRETVLQFQDLMDSREVVGGFPHLELLHKVCHRILGSDSMREYLKKSGDGEQLMALMPLISKLSSKLADAAKQQPEEQATTDEPNAA